MNLIAQNMAAQIMAVEPHLGHTMVTEGPQRHLEEAARLAAPVSRDTVVATRDCGPSSAGWPWPSGTW